MILYTEKKYDKRTLLALLSSKKTWFTVKEIPYFNNEKNSSALIELIADGALRMQLPGKMLVNRFNQEGATLYEWQDSKTA